VGAIAVLKAPPAFAGLVDTLGQRLGALRRYRQVPVRAMERNRFSRLDLPHDVVKRSFDDHATRESQDRARHLWQCPLDERCGERYRQCSTMAHTRKRSPRPSTCRHRGLRSLEDFAGERLVVAAALDLHRDDAVGVAGIGFAH